MTMTISSRDFNPKRVAEALWRSAVLKTFQQRGMLRGNGKPAVTAVVYGGRIIYLLDMECLGGLSYDALKDPRVTAQLTSACQGRRVVITAKSGLAIQVALEPGDAQAPAHTHWPERVYLPQRPPEGMVYAWPLGVTRAGEQVWASLLDTSHLLIGSKSGGGKSTLLNAALTALVRANGPDRLRLALIDGKQGAELYPWNGMPHLVRSVATTPEEAAELVQWVAQEVDQRGIWMREAGTRDLPRYNATLAKQGKAPLPLLVCVIDEVTNLIMAWGGPNSVPGRAITHIMNAGRAFGVLLVLATQHPKAEILDTLARTNAGVRVCLAVDEPEQAKVILGRSSIKDVALPHKPGRMLVQGMPGARGLVMLQGYAATDEEITSLVRAVRSHVAPLGPDGEPEVPLSADSRALLEHCLLERGGVMPVTEIIDARACEMTERRIRAAVKELVGRGLIERPVQTEPYRVSRRGCDVVGWPPRASAQSRRPDASEQVQTVQAGEELLVPA